MIDQRYSRQVLFNGIGKSGQEELASSRVVLVGAGALGASHAEMLARAGVGNLKIVDRDYVELSNLQRQTLYKESDAVERLPKAIAAQRRIREINSTINVEAVVADINRSNIESIIESNDLIIDGADNFQVRYLLNDACIKHDIPWIYGAAVSGYGATMTILPHKTPCLRCIFDEMPEPGSTPTCDTAGVIMPIIATISAIQVSEALKLLTGNAHLLHKTLIQQDIWENERTSIRPGSPDPECVCCGRSIFSFLDSTSDEFSAVLCGRDAVQISPMNTSSKFDLKALADRLAAFSEVKSNEYLVRFFDDDREVTVFSDGRAVIKGVDDLSQARSIYAKYIGT